MSDAAGVVQAGHGRGLNYRQVRVGGVGGGAQQRYGEVDFGEAWPGSLERAPLGRHFRGWDRYSKIHTVPFLVCSFVTKILHLYTQIINSLYIYSYAMIKDIHSLLLLYLFQYLLNSSP